MTVVVLAHGIGGRSDLPVPLWMALYGAAAAVVVSFVALGALWPHSRLGRPDAGIPLPSVVQRVADARVTRCVLRAVGLLLLAAVLITAAFGGPTSATNPAPTWLYVWFWVGLVPLSLLLGPVWRSANPLRALTSGSPMPVEDDAGLEVQERGRWPAVAWLFVFVWLELVYPHASEPLTVLVFVGSYVLINVGAAMWFGQAWHDRADAFELYSALIGRLAPLGRRPDGRLVLRNPLQGLAGLEVDTSLVWFVCTVLGSTVFDGLTRTQLWEDLTGGRGVLAGTAGLVAAIALVLATYLTATRLASRASMRTHLGRDAARLSDRFAHSLIPIAVGYTIAHYFSLLVFQGQAGYILGSDPLATGLDLFGTADWRINYLALSPGLIAVVQVAAIVAGHILGVVAAHDRAVGLFNGRDQTRSQYPLLAIMVAYTCGGIALLVGV